MLHYLRTRSQELDNDGIRARVKAAADELESVAQVAESERNARSVAGTSLCSTVAVHPGLLSMKRYAPARLRGRRGGSWSTVCLPLIAN
jgi:hypothetical protein